MRIMMSMEGKKNMQELLSGIWIRKYEVWRKEIKFIKNQESL
nr:hypothetical protein [uncultured Anaerostipes sp.]